MSEKNQAYKEGEDGRLYFAFNQGAAYTFSPPFCDDFTHRILECEFEEDTGKEYYRIESAGKELPARFSVSQIKLMLAQFPNEQTEEGEPVELPLLAEEVKAFYAAKRKELARENVKENDKLKGTAWNTNLKLIKTMSANLRYYQNNGNTAQAAELAKELEKVKAEQAKLLADKKVNYRILTKAADCEACHDTGLINGEICECARAITEQVKAFNAAERLAVRA